MAQILAWQELRDSACWREWSQGLEESRQEADTQLHKGLHPTNTVGIAIAQTQYNALEHFLQYPEERLAELREKLRKLEEMTAG
jgi:hypothetical protein